MSVTESSMSNGDCLMTVPILLTIYIIFMIIKIKDSNRRVSAPLDIHSILKNYFTKVDAIDRDKEHFFCFLLDSRNRVQVADLISVGILNASLAHPREVYTRAVLHRCISVVVAHNHPSGNPEPSDSDIEITHKLVSAGHILGIELMDHIIYTSESLYSFREHGLL